MTSGRLLRVGLTGGIATGKSHCLRRFAALGVPTIDADVLAHDALAAGSPGLAAVAARFGPGVLTPSGALDRRALAAIVFGDEHARRDLEAIVHPVVYAEIQAWFERLASADGDTPLLAIADVPLLFESGGTSVVDRVVVAACRPDQQLARLQARDGISADEARARLAAQWPIDRKRAVADFVIDTSSSLEETDRQVDEIHERLLAEARRKRATPGGA